MFFVNTLPNNKCKDKYNWLSFKDVEKTFENLYDRMNKDDVCSTMITFSIFVLHRTLATARFTGTTPQIPQPQLVCFRKVYSVCSQNAS